MSVVDSGELEAMLRDARPGDRASVSAIRWLLRAGLGVLQPVFAAFKRAPTNSAGLAEVVARSSYPEAIPLLIENAMSPSIQISESSMIALGAIDEVRAQNFLLDMARDREKDEVIRSFAVSALGRSPSEEVIEVFRLIVAERASSVEDPYEPHFLLLAALVALAQNGDNANSSLLLNLAGMSGSAAQESAIRALEIAVTDGMVDVLTRASRDPSPSVSTLTARPLFLIGDAQSGEALLSLIGSSENDARYNAQIFLEIMIGRELSLDDVDSYGHAWRSFSSSISPQICYRRGEPIRIRQLTDEWNREADIGIREDRAREIQCRTGLDASGAALLGTEQDLINTIDRLELEDGGLYRWGHRQEFPRG